MNKNRELYLEICNILGIGSDAEAALLLYEKGYENYNGPQSVRNRFRSGNTRTDFFWDLLNAGGCEIEIRKNSEPSRAELLERIETLENEQKMLEMIDPNMNMIRAQETLTGAILGIEKVVESESFAEALLLVNKNKSKKES